MFNTIRGNCTRNYRTQKNRRSVILKNCLRRNWLRCLMPRSGSWTQATSNLWNCHDISFSLCPFEMAQIFTNFSLKFSFLVCQLEIQYQSLPSPDFDIFIFLESYAIWSSLRLLWFDYHHYYRHFKVHFN